MHSHMHHLFFFGGMRHAVFSKEENQSSKNDRSTMTVKELCSHQKVYISDRRGRGTLLKIRDGGGRVNCTMATENFNNS